MLPASLDIQQDAMFSQLVNDIAFWSRIKAAQRKFSNLIYDSIDAQGLLPNLFSRTDEFLTVPTTRRLITILPNEFLIEYLLANPARVSELFNAKPPFYLDFLTKLNPDLLLDSPENIYRKITLAHNIFHLQKLSKDDSLRALQSWIFMLLGDLIQIDSKLKAQVTSARGALIIWGSAEEIALREEYVNFVSNYFQVILHVCVTLQIYFKTCDVKMHNSKQQTPLHFLALIKFEHPEIASLIAVLLSKGADIRAKDESGLTPVDLMLQNPNINDLRKMVFISSNQTPDKINLTDATPKKLLSTAELEKILFNQVHSETKSILNIKGALQALAAHEGWENFALYIQGISLWQHKHLIDLNLVPIAAAFIHSCRASLTIVINAIRGANQDATFAIASCIQAMPEVYANNKNIMVYLAANPILCTQLTSQEHIGMVSVILNISQKKTAQNIVKACFVFPDGPIDVAIEQGNLAFLALVLQFGYISLSSQQTSLLKDAILKLCKHTPDDNVDVNNLEQYLVETAGCLPGYHSTLLKNIRANQPHVRRVIPGIVP